MVWANKASLTPSLFIEVPVPSHESQRSCICVLRGTKPWKSEVMYFCINGIDFASFYNFCIELWTFSDSVIFFFDFMTRWSIVIIIMIILYSVSNTTYKIVLCKYMLHYATRWSTVVGLHWRSRGSALYIITTCSTLP